MTTQLQLINIIITIIIIIKFAYNSTKLTCLEITGYRIKYNTVFMVSRTSNQVWSKVLEASTYCK